MGFARLQQNPNDLGVAMSTEPGGEDPLVRLQRLYREHAGIETVSGLNPLHFNAYRDASFTHYVRDGGSLTPDLGLSLVELMVIERFCRVLRPRCIYIVGNGLGWSALGLALMNPAARVLVVEPHAGIELTNAIARAEGIDCTVAQGFSPADNARILRDHATITPDLVLIDGQHTNVQIEADFASVSALCGRSATYLFHDVVNFRLYDGLAKVAEAARPNGMVTELLVATPSGMAIVYPGDAPAALSGLVRLFNPSVDAMGPVAQAAGMRLPPVWTEIEREAAAEAD